VPPDADAKWIEIQRAMSPGDKLCLVLEESDQLLKFYEMAVRRQHPHATDREVLLRVAARHLDRDLMIKAYGWDPESGDPPKT
jgi:hypothetical protein